jgi:hypothetical protein
MKMNSIIKRTSLAIAISGLFCGKTTAQDQSQLQGKSEATIELSYNKKADMSKTAVAVIKAKNNVGKFVSAKNARVNFYVIHDNRQQLLKSANTDNKGQAVIVLQNELPLDENHSFTIVAKIENDSLYEDAEEQVHYKDASLSINLDPDDTARLITAKVTEIGKDGKEEPVKGAEVKFYVQRLFGFMPASDDNTVETDDNGISYFTFPKTIAGDSAGVITIVARLEDSEQFGNVENKVAASWGTVLAIEKDPFPRALWEPYAPLPLVITISTLFGGVWCIYLFIWSQLRKIKKEEQLTINDSTL